MSLAVVQQAKYVGTFEGREKRGLPLQRIVLPAAGAAR